MAARPDLRTIDVLARVQLAARRAGLELRVRHVPPELRELIALCGLGDALRVEPERKPEEREERLGAEEEGQLGDPPV
jgi:anti-anti-sigma regulatory factor